MKTVLITGATGLVGNAIVAQCRKQNIVVHYLSTSKDKVVSEPYYKGFFWNPSIGEVDERCLEGVDVIINLAGTPISKRWTTSYKKEILESRLQSLDVLRQLLERVSHTVKHIVSASAIGIYQDSLTNYYEEDSPKISYSFLGQVVEQWEAKVDRFKTLNLLVSKIRIGLVLDRYKGALPQMVKPVKYGLGAAFGSGEQWQSWIHIDDLSRAFMHVALHQLEGTYNAVAPNPVTNEELIKSTAEVLKRPLILPKIPKLMMSLILGEMHILLFESQRVSSQKLEQSGFEFTYYKLRPALENLLK